METLIRFMLDPAIRHPENLSALRTGRLRELVKAINTTIFFRALRNFWARYPSLYTEEWNNWIVQFVNAVKRESGRQRAENDWAYATESAAQRLGREAQSREQQEWRRDRGDRH